MKVISYFHQTLYIDLFHHVQTCGILYTVYGIRYTVFGIWHTVYGIHALRQFNDNQNTKIHCFENVIDRRIRNTLNNIDKLTYLNTVCKIMLSILTPLA